MDITKLTYTIRDCDYTLYYKDCLLFWLAMPTLNKKDKTRNRLTLMQAAQGTIVKIIDGKGLPTMINRINMIDNDKGVIHNGY